MGVSWYGAEDQRTTLRTITVVQLGGNMKFGFVCGENAKEFALDFVFVPQVDVSKHEVDDDLVNSTHESEISVVAMAKPVSEKDDIIWGGAQVTKFSNGLGDRVASGLGRCDYTRINVVLFGMTYILEPLRAMGVLACIHLNMNRHKSPLRCMFQCLRS